MAALGTTYFCAKWGIYTPMGAGYTRGRIHGEESTLLAETALLQNEHPATLTDARGEAAGRARTNRSAAWRVASWVAGFLLALWLALQWGQGTGVHNDFTQNVWLPSHLLLDGVNPYSPTRAQVDTTLGSYAAVFTEFNSGKNYHAIYPIWISLVFTPFAALPLQFSLALWRALNLLILLWGLVHLLRVCNSSFRSTRFAAVAATAITLVLAVIYRETIVTLFSGQFSIIEFGLLVGIWGYLISSRNDEGNRRLVGEILTGVALAVLATKPQAVGLPVLLLGLWAMTRRRWAIPVAAVVSLALLLVVPLLVYPSSLDDWLGIVAGGQASSQAEVSASVWGLSYQWLHTFVPWMPVAAVLTITCLVALVPGWRRDLLDRTSPVPQALPLAICMNAIVSPYMLGYEQVLLLIPAMIFLAAAGLPDEQSDATSRRWRLAVYGWMAVLPFLIVVVQALFIDKEYPVVLQTATMLVMCWMAQCGLRIVRNAPASRFFLLSQRTDPQPEGGFVGLNP